MDVPKYARIEYERRFLVDPSADWRRTAKPYSKLLEDRYLDCGRRHRTDAPDRRMYLSEQPRFELMQTHQTTQELHSCMVQTSPDIDLWELWFLASIT